MAIKKWSIAIPLAVLVLGASASGSAIRDEAKIFGAQAKEEAQSRLDRLERATHVPVVIETIEHVPGLSADSPKNERHEAINRLAERRDSQIHDEGIYILISKKDQVISQPLIRARLQRLLPMSRRDAIREAFIAGFKKENFDEGLKQGVSTIEKALSEARVENKGGARAGLPAPIGHGGPPAHVRGGGSLLGTFLLIGLGILAVLLLLRILGGLFGRSGAGYPGQMGGMGGPRPGMGPGGPGYYGGGYGGPGYGGRGGFFSGLLGGLGGALAGNWLYDQMSGRHGGMTSSSAGYPTGESSSMPDQGDDAIVGADDHAGSWDDGSNTGGGDWGGGDQGGGDQGGDWGGGGGDWGGGGGDWGGGGGDWGGGGGGGDW
jgi:TPM domain